MATITCLGLRLRSRLLRLLDEVGEDEVGPEALVVGEEEVAGGLIKLLDAETLLVVEAEVLAVVKDVGAADVVLLVAAERERTRAVSSGRKTPAGVLGELGAVVGADPALVCGIGGAVQAIVLGSNLAGLQGHTVGVGTQGVAGVRAQVPALELDGRRDNAAAAVDLLAALGGGGEGTSESEEGENVLHGCSGSCVGG